MKRLSDLRRRQLADIEQRYGIINQSSVTGTSAGPEPVTEPRSDSASDRGSPEDDR